MRANNENTATVDRSVSLMLRGVAILIVVFSHYTEWMFMPSPAPDFTSTLSTLGPIGVDIFFVLSGYGLYMSAHRKNASGSPGFRFLLKRLLNVYIPYLLIASAINIITSGSMFREPKVFVSMLTGGDYWYIRVLLIFYIFFMLSFTLFKKLRLFALTIMVIVYTSYLYNHAYRDFWTLSNLAFPIGSCMAALDMRLGKYRNRNMLRITISLVSVALTYMCYLLMMNYGGSGNILTYQFEFTANLFFSVFVISAAGFIKSRRYTVLKLLGTSSLFHYLLHTIIYCNLILVFEKSGYVVSMLASALICIIISAVLYQLYTVFVNKLVKPAVIGRLGKRRDK